MCIVVFFKSSLDFLTFAISQPNAETVCAVDSFNVAGAGNAVPSICGDNPGQHSRAYLNYVIMIY